METSKIEEVVKKTQVAEPVVLNEVFKEDKPKEENKISRGRRFANGFKLFKKDNPALYKVMLVTLVAVLLPIILPLLTVGVGLLPLIGL